MKYFSIVVLFLLALTGCEKEKSQAEKDDEIINNYLTENNKEATKHSSGLYYQIIEEGAGGHPNINSLIEFRYKGYLTNNNVFDETTGSETVNYPLSRLIPGWQYCIPLLQKGGKGIFYIPSGLGYGSQPTGSIPANSVLIFDIELVNFN